ncbi:MAG: hypothetical protein WD646_15870 [Actinomycetota bacterium]
MSFLVERLGRTAAIAGWQLVGALLIGIATIFVMKHDPREHWAIPPTSRLVLVLDDVGRSDELDNYFFIVRDGLMWPREPIA